MITWRDLSGWCMCRDVWDYPKMGKYCSDPIVWEARRYIYSISSPPRIGEEVNGVSGCRGQPVILLSLFLLSPNTFINFIIDIP